MLMVRLGLWNQGKNDTDGKWPPRLTSGACNVNTTYHSEVSPHHLTMSARSLHCEVSIALSILYVLEVSHYIQFVLWGRRFKLQSLQGVISACHLGFFLGENCLFSPICLLTMRFNDLRFKIFIRSPPSS